MKRYRTKRQPTRCGMRNMEALTWKREKPLFDRSNMKICRYSQETKDAVMNLVDGGMPRRQAARLYGVPISTARGWV